MWPQIVRIFRTGIRTCSRDQKEYQINIPIIVYIILTEVNRCINRTGHILKDIIKLCTELIGCVVNFYGANHIKDRLEDSH